MQYNGLILAQNVKQTQLLHNVPHDITQRTVLSFVIVVHIAVDGRPPGARLEAPRHCGKTLAGAHKILLNVITLPEFTSPVRL